MDGDRDAALQRWRALAEPIQFTSEDFEVLDLALGVIPDLRICALALKEARTRKVRYPIQSVDELLSYLEKGQFVAGNHLIDTDEIRNYMSKDLFPIEHEGEFLTNIYLALGRQRNAAALLSALSQFDSKTVEKLIATHQSQEGR